MGLEAQATLTRCFGLEADGAKARAQLASNGEQVEGEGVRA